MRENGRKNNELRKISIKRDYLKHPEGSVLIEMGNTRVICTASVEESVPPHRKNTGLGWVTAEYGMLPRSTHSRMQRESIKGKVQGRTQEIQRLIGRALRSVVDMGELGERSVVIDADVIQADGGTRTAAITGSFVALYDALSKLVKNGKISKLPVTEYLSAVSVGIRGGAVLLDLDYSEDSTADVDMNVVMTESGKFVEVQGTAESGPFTKSQLNSMLRSAQRGIKKLVKAQKRSHT